MIPKRIRKSDAKQLRKLLLKLLKESIPKNTIYLWGLSRDDLAKNIYQIKLFPDKLIEFYYTKPNINLPLTGLAYGHLQLDTPFRFVYAELKSLSPTENRKIGFSAEVTQTGIIRKGNISVPSYELVLKEYDLAHGKIVRSVELEHYHDYDNLNQIPKGEVSKNNILIVAEDPILGKAIQRKYNNFGGLNVKVTNIGNEVASYSFSKPANILLSPRHFNSLLFETHKIFYKTRELRPDAQELLKRIGVWELLPKDHPLKNLRKKR